MRIFNSLRPFLTLLIFIFAPTAFSIVDFCDGDPRLVTTVRTCPHAPGTTKKLLLYLPEISSNPYHAMQDRLWPLAYYLNHCTAGFNVSIMFNRHEKALPSQCLLETPPPVIITGLWSRCAALFIIHLAGVPEQNLFWNRPRFGRKWWAPRGGQACYDKTVALGVKPSFQLDKSVEEGTWRFGDYFRRLTWYGRDCTSSRNRTEKWQNSWACAGRGPLPLSTVLVDLPCAMKKKAFEYVQNAFLVAAGIKQVAHNQPTIARTSQKEASFHREDREVRVVLYGREEAPRRVWKDVERAFDVMKKDKRINLKWLRRMPPGFASQVKLFRWADVIVSNHGAALANTVAMYRGAEVIEIAKECQWDINNTRWQGKDWTGWHTPLLGIGVSYVACNAQEAGDKDTPVTVDIEEFKEVLEIVLERQQLRIDRLVGATTSQRLWPFERQSFDMSSIGIIAVIASWWAAVVLALRGTTFGNAKS